MEIPIKNFDGHISDEASTILWPLLACAAKYAFRMITLTHPIIFSPRMWRKMKEEWERTVFSDY